MINAAVVAMASTMTGQLAAGASFGDAFAAGIKAGATSAVTAGLLNAPVIDTAQGMQSINQLANVQTTGANIVGSFNADTFGQNLVGMAARGVVNAGVNTAIYGGRFGDAFKSSLVSDLAAVGANAVGLSSNTLSPENIIGHAAVGAVAAQLKGQDAWSGAIGGAGAAIVNPLLDQAIGGADGSGWGNDPPSAQQMQSATLQLGSMALSGGVAAALGKDGMTAALAAQNETVNNFLTKENILQKQARLAQARTNEEKTALAKDYIGVSNDNRNRAFSDLKSTVTVDVDLEQKRAELQNILTGPLTPALRADVLNSISEINGLLRSAHASEKLEPVLLVADVLLTTATLGESVLGKLGLRAVSELAEVAGANRLTRYGTTLSEEVAALGRISAANNSVNGTIANSRISLKPYVVRGDVNGLIAKLDVSTGSRATGFWSGNLDAAMSQADLAGVALLETTPGGKIASGWSFLNKKLDWANGGEQFWGDLSSKYASKATGDVHVWQAPDRAINSSGVLDWKGGYVWQKYEQPVVTSLQNMGTVGNINYQLVEPTILNSPLRWH
jgi:hypothetical protein